MSDSEEHHFESKADAGASKTYPQQAGTIRKNGYIVIKNRPCKVCLSFFLFFFGLNFMNFYLGLYYFFQIFDGLILVLIIIGALLVVGFFVFSGFFFCFGFNFVNLYLGSCDYLFCLLKLRFYG